MTEPSEYTIICTKESWKHKLDNSAELTDLELIDVDLIDPSDENLQCEIGKILN